MSTQTDSVAAALGERELAAWRAFLRAHARVTRLLDADLIAAHGLTLRDYEVLLHLAQAPERHLRMSDLADRLVLSRSGVTRLVDGLVGEGFVRRESCPEDARVSYATLTDAGHEKLREAAATHLAGIRRVFVDPLSPDGVAALEGLLAGLAAPDVGPDCTVE